MTVYKEINLYESILPTIYLHYYLFPFQTDLKSLGLLLMGVLLLSSTDLRTGHWWRGEPIPLS